MTLNTSSYNSIFHGECRTQAAVVDALANGLLSNLTVAVMSCKFHSCVHFLELTSKHLHRPRVQRLKGEVFIVRCRSSKPQGKTHLKNELRLKSVVIKHLCLN